MLLFFCVLPKKRNSNRFGMIWERVNNGRFFGVVVNCPFKYLRARWGEGTNESGGEEFQPHLRYESELAFPTLSNHVMAFMASALQSQQDDEQQNERNAAELSVRGSWQGHRLYCLLPKQVSGSDPAVRAGENKQGLHWNALCICRQFSYKASPMWG